MTEQSGPQAEAFSSVEEQWSIFHKNVKFFPAKERADFYKAATLSEAIHLTRKQRNGEPELDHVLNVDNNILEYGVRDANTITSGLLHDSVEANYGYALIEHYMKQAGATEDEILNVLGSPEDESRAEHHVEIALGIIEREFNPDVAEIVNLTTMRKDPPETSLENRFVLYAVQMGVIRLNPRAFTVKLADLGHNIPRLLKELRFVDSASKEAWLKTALKYLEAEMEVHRGLENPNLTKIIPLRNFPRVYHDTVHMFSDLRRAVLKQIPSLEKLVA